MPSCQMVMGPAGTGKSTYCRLMQEHCANGRRKVHVANLDPAAEAFEYDVAFDIRDLITLEDAMEECGLGPNGALVYCMEYLLDNMEWLKDALDEYDDDEYIIFDCPGQIELYSHIPVMRQVVEQLQLWSIPVVAVYCLDATFLAEPRKFIAGTLLTLSAMTQLGIPHLNVLTKCDLADREEVDRFLDAEGASVLLAADPWRYRHDLTPPDPGSSSGGGSGGGGGESSGSSVGGETAGGRGEGDGGAAAAAAPARTVPVPARLTAAIAGVIDDYMMVGFVPLDASDEDSVAEVMARADHALQYGEGLEPRDREGPMEDLVDNGDGADAGRR